MTSTDPICPAERHGQHVSPTITVVVPTLDEELHIRRALEAASPLGPCVVVDSGSTDGTELIAAELGARVLTHAWQGHAAQKNWALAQVDTEWVFFLDADEIVSSALAAEIKSVVANAVADGYFVPRRSLFLGKPLLHAGWYPDHQLRLFRAGRGRFEDRLVHEHVVVDGTTGFLTNDLVHDNIKGIDHLVAKHRVYAALEAQEMVRHETGSASTERKGSLRGSWPERRRWLKTNVWYRLPGRPAVRFAWLYGVKRGFLDGRRGYEYARLIAGYEREINRELLADRNRSSA